MMKKKTYTVPQLVVLKIDVPTLMAGSLNLGQTPTNLDDVGNGGDDTDGMYAGSRGFDLWGEED